MLLSCVELFASGGTLGSVEVLAGAGFCCARDDERTPSLSLGFVFDAVFFPLRSDAVFAFLYSILFCSKLGSSRYSSKAPANDTGA